MRRDKRISGPPLGRTVSRALALAAMMAGPLAAAEGGESGVFAGDIGNALWTLLIFGIVVFVLGKFAWGPILQGLSTREEFIRAALAKAQADREEAQARLEEYLEKIRNARGEATAIVDEGRRDAEAVKRRIVEEGQSEAAASLERARREISIAKDTALKEIYGVAGRLATEAASRIVRRELDPKDQDRLIAESIADLERAPRRADA